MGVVCKRNIITKLQDEFHAIDKIITGYAYNIHNDIGRFCDEKIYQNIMVEKCIQSSIKVDQEVGITIKHKDFIKTYKLDLLVDNGIIYELKAAHVSAIKRSLEGYEKNIRRLIKHTDIDAVQWINFNQSNIKIETIKEI